MADPVARCRACDAIFTAPGLFGPSSGVTLKDCATDCPKCGGTAELLDGTFDLTSDQVRVIDGPVETHALVAMLQRIIAEARASKKNNAELIDEIEKVSPELASALRPLPASQFRQYFCLFCGL